MSQPLAWFADVPRVPGFYWFQPAKGRLSVVELTVQEVWGVGLVLQMWHTGTRVYERPEDTVGCRWFGPLEPPS